MAIVGMKKLRVIAAVSQRDELVSELQKLGCVELRQMGNPFADDGNDYRLSYDQGDVVGAHTQRQIYADAIKILDKHVPKKTPLLAPKPDIGQAELLDGAGEEELKSSAKLVSFMDEKLKELDANETRERLLMEALEPWMDCDIPLDTEGTKNVAVSFGIIPAATDMDGLCARLSEAVDEAELSLISSDDKASYVLLFCLRARLDEAMSILHDAGFTAASFGGAKGLAKDAAAASEEYLKQIDEERRESLERIAAVAEKREGIRAGFDRAGAFVEREEAKCLLARTETAVVLEGWAVAEQESAVAALLEGMGCAWELLEPAEEEYPDVPVKLKNNRLTDGLNMVTDMYSLPQYGTVDPNPLMAPFFILFYGIMMADIGYGLVMMLIGALITFIKKPREGFMRYFGELMLEGGLATALMGVLTGGFFGDALKWIVQLINPDSTWQGLPALIDPLNDTVMVLVGALILGFIHLNAGMVVGFVMKVKKGETLSALCEEGALWVLFIGAGLTLLGIGGSIGIIVGAAAYVLGKVLSGKGFGRITGIFSGLYNDLTGWFGDILSYARLMALMLAGSVIAQVFNTLGAMPGNIFIFLIICLLGNTLNFGLNLLGCYVHDLRLQCLEFFNKFYVAGGRPFRPLAVRSKYYNVNK